MRLAEAEMVRQLLKVISYPIQGEIRMVDPNLHLYDWRRDYCGLIIIIIIIMFIIACHGVNENDYGRIETTRNWSQSLGEKLSHDGQESTVMERLKRLDAEVEDGQKRPRGDKKVYCMEEIRKA